MNALLLSLALTAGAEPEDWKKAEAAYLTNIKQLTSDYVRAGEGYFSPDGTKIIFQVFRHGAWLLDLADGSMQRVLTDPTAEEFAWSPDGRRVAFHSRRDGQWGIYVLLRS